jgi:Ca2+-binding EF-hand superfamily protein
MLNNNLYSYDNIRIIKKTENRKLFVRYLIDVFHNIVKNDSESETKVINKLSFLNYIGMPYLVSDKIYKLFSREENSIDLNTFLAGMKRLYNSSLEESIKTIFNLLDFDNDGYIIPQDVRLLVSFTVSKNNRSIEELDSIINEFFTSKKLDFQTFKDKVSSSNSDVYFVLYYYIIENAPFNEHNLEIYKYSHNKLRLKHQNLNDSAIDLNNSLDNSTMSGDEDLPNFLRSPSKRLSRFYKDNIGELELFDDEDLVLKELEDIETQIKIPKIITKGIRFIEQDEARLKIDQVIRTIYNNYSILNHTTIMDKFIYRIKNQTGNLILDLSWVILLKKHLYFLDSKKRKLKKMYNLSSCYILDKIDTFEYNEEHFYYITVKMRNKYKQFFFKTISDCKYWINKLKAELNQRNIKDKYQFLSQIGSGTYGKVYLAKDIKTEERVAIKTFDKKDNKEELEKIKLEIDIMKFCNHKNIVKYIDSFEDSEFIYLVQEYMDSGDLFHYISNKSLLNESEIKNIIRQVAQGLKYLHYYGIIHRDLKPQNILIKNREEVKIIDFGLSKVLGNYETTNDCLGTIYFTSPEVLKQDKYNNKVDVWSLGIILYFLVYGRVPYDDSSNNVKEIMNKICNVNLKLLNNKKISDKLKNLILGCLEKDYSKRLHINDCINHEWML